MDTGLYFSCKIGGLPDDTFDVFEFTLNEGLSELFTLTLTLVSKNANIVLNDQLLQQASLTVSSKGVEQRTISGLVASIEQGDSGFRRTFYTIVIKPELWKLTLKQDSRIFHFKSVPDILDALLREHRLVAKNQLQDEHQSREYVTQKRESDYAFFSRLAAEEGISFWFEQKGLFYSDSHLGMTAGIDLSYNTHIQSATQGDFIHKLRVGFFMCPEAAIYKDRNYANPNYALQHQAAADLGRTEPYSVFESYGRFQKDNAAEPFTKYRLEALRNNSQSGSAETNCIRLMPGKIFIIAEHPSKALNDRWQVVTVTHHGKMPQALEEESNGGATTLTNQVEFVPGYNDWRPPFHYKPLADGDEVATVVGPATEEIYVNKDGAIRVHFHWNRYDEADDKASCWVRVAQGWNGNGYGFLATPRIGQEVIISYMNGDIDRPLVTGCTYNGKNRPPLDLPASKTQTTFKTQTHKGAGFNELRFEDESGKEEVFIHAQKDMNTIVLDQRTTDVGSHHTETIGGNQTIDVKKNQTETIDGNQTLLVKKSQAETVLLAKAETIGLAKALSIGTAYQVSVGMMMNASVGIAQASQIGLTKSLLVGQSYSANIGQKVTYTVGEHKIETVGKVSVHSVGEYFELVCGKAKIVLTNDGTIYLKGERIEFQANGAINGDANQIQWNCGAAQSPPNRPEAEGSDE